MAGEFGELEFGELLLDEVCPPVSGDQVSDRGDDWIPALNVTADVSPNDQDLLKGLPL